MYIILYPMDITFGNIDLYDDFYNIKYVLNYQNSKFLNYTAQSKH